MVGKLGDLAIALSIVTFVILGLSAFIIEADNISGVNSGLVKSNLTSIEGELTSDFTSFDSQLTTKIDNSSTYVPDPNVEIENRGDESLGILNLISKNIFEKFLNSISGTIKGSGVIISFLISLLGIYASILLLRAWRGDNKI